MIRQYNANWRPSTAVKIEMSTTHFKVYSHFLGKWPTPAITIGLFHPPPPCTIYFHPLLFSFWLNNRTSITAISYMKQKPNCRCTDLSIDVRTGLVLKVPDHYQLHSHCPICKVKELGLCHDKIRSKLSRPSSPSVVLKTRSSVWKWLLCCNTDYTLFRVKEGICIAIILHAYIRKAPGTNIGRNTRSL